MKLLDFLNAHDLCEYCGGCPELRCKVLLDYPVEGQFAADRGFMIFKKMKHDQNYYSAHRNCILRRTPRGRDFHHQLQGDFT